MEDEIKRQCTARSKRSGVRCRRHAMVGGSVCATHGGKAPRVLAAAQRRVELEAAERAVVTLGLSRVVSPGEALLEEVHRTAGHVAWLQAKVREFDDTDLVSRVMPAGVEPDQVEKQRAVAASTWLDLYSRERDRLVRVCSESLRAGVDERRVQLAEAQGQQVGHAIQRILEGLNLNAAQQALVPSVVPAALRALAG